MQAGHATLALPYSESEVCPLRIVTARRAAAGITDLARDRDNLDTVQGCVGGIVADRQGPAGRPNFAACLRSGIPCVVRRTASHVVQMTGGPHDCAPNRA
jgi:hypothetical protein